MTVPNYVRAHARQGRVPLSTKIYQGIGALPEAFKGFGFGTFLLFFYSQVLGASPVLVSLAIGLTTFLDGAIDPLIGSFSDNLRTRLGRRHPLMYASILPLMAGLYLVFTPPTGLEGPGLFAWIFASTALVNFSISVFSVPWTALMAEFSDDYAERTEIVIWRYAVGWTGALIFNFSVWTFVFPSTTAFTPGQLNPHSYGVFAPVLAVAAGLAVLLTTQLTRREIPFLVQPTHIAPFGVRRTLSELFSMLSNRDFLVLFVGALITACIGGTVGSLGTYTSTYFWGLAPAQLRWFSLAVIGAVLAFVTLPLLQKHFDKKTLLIAAFGLALVDGVTIIGLRLLDMLPANGTPTLFAILVTNQVFRTYLDTILGVMFVSMMADSLDFQELRTGRRQEGMFAAALSFSTKATAGIGVFVAGLVLQNLIRWPAKGHLGPVDPEAIIRLGLVAGVMVPLFYIIPLCTGFLYRITREQHADIRRQVEARRAAVKL